MRELADRGFVRQSTFTPPEDPDGPSPASGSNQIPMPRPPRRYSHWYTHTQMMDRLLDPRLRPSERTFEAHPADGTYKMIGLHRLPPSIEVQRKMLWSFVRLPTPPGPPEISFRTLVGLKKGAERELRHTEQILAA